MSSEYAIAALDAHEAFWARKDCRGGATANARALLAALPHSLLSLTLSTAPDLAWIERLGAHGRQSSGPSMTDAPASYSRATAARV